jgi:acetylglutamate kinase
MSASIRVYKLGGRTLEDPVLIAALAAELQTSEQTPFIVHGGGSRVTQLLERLEIESLFVGGRRATSSDAMEVVEMVLSGSLNKQLAGTLTAAGVPAVGISGRDGGMIRAKLEPGLDRVGRPETIDTSLLLRLAEGGWVPVVSPVCSGPNAEPVNVNADEAALALACALGAHSLVYLSDVDGVRNGDELAAELDADAARQAIDEGIICGGMSLKVQVALDATRAGIEEVIVAGVARLRGGFPGTRIRGNQREGTA